MQTFCPYPNTKESARVLDYRRLGKQRVEAKQIYHALTEHGYGWQHHPILTMWRGHEKALLRYGIDICREWRRRGYRDSLLPWFLHEYKLRTERLRFPPWWGDERVHLSHRSNLLRKNFQHYVVHFGTECPTSLPYVWVRTTDGGNHEIG